MTTPNIFNYTAYNEGYDCDLFEWANTPDFTNLEIHWHIPKNKNNIIMEVYHSHDMECEYGIEAEFPSHLMNDHYYMARQLDAAREKIDQLRFPLLIN